MSNFKNSIVKWLAVMSAVLVVIISACTIALARAQVTPLVPFSHIKSYFDNGGKYNYIEYGRYPKTLIGEYDTSSEDDEVRIISTLISRMHTTTYSGSNLSSCYVSKFFPQTSKSITHSVGGKSYTISYDADSNYYTLGTAVGSYKAGTQIYTYNQVADVFSKDQSLFDFSTTRIDDTSIGGIYTDYYVVETDIDPEVDPENLDPEIDPEIDPEVDPEVDPENTDPENVDPIEEEEILDNVRYNDGKIYLFLVEPIKWRVLDKGSNNVATLMAEDIIDSSSWYAGDITSGETFSSSGIVNFINGMSTLFNYSVTDQGRFNDSGVKQVDSGWVLNSNGYWESTNKGYHSTYVQCRVDFTIRSFDNKITIRCINYAESNYDFGYFSNIDSTLPADRLDINGGDGGDEYFHSFRGNSSALEQDITYDRMANGSPIPSGEHYFYVRYRKDTSVNDYNDSLQFKIVSSVGTQDNYTVQFFDKAFNDTEQNSVAITTLSDVDNIKCNVYLPMSNGVNGELDITNYGLNITSNRLASPTDYAKIAGTKYDEATGYGEYWLRGYNAGNYGYVCHDGSIGYEDFTTKGIRPIIKIDLDDIDAYTFNDDNYLGESHFSGNISPLEEGTSSSSPVVFPSAMQEDAVLTQYKDGGKFLTAFSQYPNAHIDIAFNATNGQYEAHYSGFPANSKGFLAVAYVPASNNASIGAITPLLSSASGDAYISRPESGKMYVYYISEGKIYSCIDLTEYPPVYLNPSSGNDNNDGYSPQTALKNLQTAIAKAEMGQPIIVLSTIYTNSIFAGRSGYSSNAYFPNSSSVTERRVNESGHPITLIRDFDDHLFSIAMSGGVNITFNNITFKDATNETRHYPVVRTQNFPTSNSTYAHPHHIRFDNVTAKGFKIDGSGAFLSSIGSYVYFRNGCDISNNTATGDGGAIYLHDNYSFYIQNTTNSEYKFEDNHADSLGGVIYSDGYIYIGDSNNTSSNVYFRRNSATNGGAIYNSKNIMSFYCYNSPCYYFENNTASSCGGAIYSKASLSYSGSYIRVFMTGNSAGGNGGAVYLDVGNSSLSYNVPSQLNNNHATKGGGVYINNSSSATFTLRYLYAEGNYSTQGGGTVYAVGDLTIQASSIKFSNRSRLSPYNIVNASGGDGGAVYAGANLTIYNENYFTYNYSKGNGGGIYCCGTITMSSNGGESYMYGNKADNNGGAIYACSGLNTASNSTYLYMSLHNYNFNEAKLGGGIYIENTGAVSQFYRITFSGKSQDHGGGLYINNNSNSTITFTNCGAQTCVGKQAGIMYLDGKNLVIERTTSGYGDYTASTSHYSTYTYTATDGNGGAFSVNNGTVSIKNEMTSSGYSISFNNWSANGKGGAIYCTRDVSIQVKYNNLTFSGNRSVGNGGAIYAGGAVSIKRIDFTNNNYYTQCYISFSSNSSSNGNGGAIYSAGKVEVDLTIAHSLYYSPLYLTMTGNTAQSGGAIYSASSVTMRAGNTYYYSSHVNIYNNGATSGNGGGIYSTGNCSLTTGTNYQYNYISLQSNYAANGNGGGVYCGGEMSLTSEYAYHYVYDNSAKNGGGIYSKGNLSITVNSGAYTSTNQYYNRATAGNGGMIYCEHNISVANNSTSYMLYIGSSSSSSSSFAVNKGGLVYAEGNFTQSGTGKLYFGYSYVSDMTKSDNAGGAIYLNGVLTLTNAEFNNCRVYHGNGGALYIKNQHSLKNVTFNNCYAGYYSYRSTFCGGNGGAIYSEYPLTLYDCSFTGCYCLLGNGGAVFTESGKNLTMYIAGSSSRNISSCYAVHGGAIYCGGNLNIVRGNGATGYYSIYSNGTVYCGDRIVGDGGAIYCNGTLSIDGANIYSNGYRSDATYYYKSSGYWYNSSTSVYVKYGGAIYSKGAISLSDVSLYNNTAEVGGAIYSLASVSITQPSSSRHSIYGNTATNGSIIYLANATQGLSITITGNANYRYGSNTTSNNISSIYNFYSGSDTGRRTLSYSNTSSNICINVGNIIVEYVDFVSSSILRAENGYVSAENASFNKGTGATTANSGGAIYASSYVSATNATFRDCVSYNSGGAIYSSSSYVSASNSTFTNCSSSTSGGAVYSKTYCSANNCSFDSCSSASGGAIYASSYVSASDTTFTNCTASTSGGAVYCSGYCEMSNCSFDSCGSPYGSAVYTNPTASGTTSTFVDCTFTGNSSTGTGSSVSGLVCLGGRFLQNMSFLRCCFENNTSANGALIRVRKDCYVLVQDSTMLHNSNLQQSNSGSDYDIAQYTNRGGMFFVHNGGGLVIRDSILSHNLVTSQGQGADVFVCKGGSLEISDTYLGECSAKSITANNYSADDKFYSIYAETNCPTLSFSRIKVLSNTYLGGGVIFADSDATIRDSLFYSNTANQLIGVNHGTLTMSNCNIEENTVSTHGVIYVGGEGKFMSFASEFLSNSSNSYGTAIYLDSSSSGTSGGVASINSTLFSKNSTSIGGIVYVSYGALCSISNSTFEENISEHSEIHGLCIYNAGTLSISDTRFSKHNLPSIEDNIYGGAIYSVGEGSNLIVNDISIEDSDITGGQICVQDSHAILEIRGLMLSNTVSGIVSNNAQLYLVDCNISGNYFTSPIIQLTGTGTLGLIGTTFADNEMSSTSLIDISSAEDTSVIIDNCAFSSNRVTDGKLLNLEEVGRVSIKRTIFDSNEISMLGDFSANLVYIYADVVEIDSCRIVSSQMSTSQPASSTILKIDARGNNVNLSSLSLEANSCEGATALGILIDTASFVSLRTLHIADCEDMHAMTIDGSGNVKVEGSLDISTCEWGVELTSSANLELKHDLAISITDITLGEDSMILLDGVLDSTSSVFILNTEVDKSVVSSLSGSKLSSAYITSFHMSEGYVLAIDYDSNSAVIRERQGIVTQDVVCNVSTKGNLVSPFVLSSEDFVLSTPWEDYSVLYKLDEEGEYTSSAPQFSRVGAYVVYFKLTSVEEEEEGVVNVYLEPQSLHLKSSPVARVAYGSLVKDATFTSYQVVNDEGASVSGKWSFSTSVTDSTRAERLLEQYEVIFTPYNTHVYGDVTVTTSIILQIYFDELYYVDSHFAQSSSSQALEGIDSLSQALEYMTDYGSIHFLSTYLVTGMENVSSSRSVYLLNDVSGGGELIRVSNGASLYLSGKTGKIIIDGVSGLNRDVCAIRNNGNLSLGRNLIIRNFALKSGEAGAIYNVGSLILDGCDIYDISSDNGSVYNYGGTIIISSGNFYRNAGQNCAFIYNDNGGELVVNGGSIYANTGSSILTSNAGSVFLNSGIIKNNQSTGCVVDILSGCKLYLAGTHILGNVVDNADIGYDEASVIITMDTDSTATSSLHSPTVAPRGVDWSYYVLLILLCALSFMIFVSAVRIGKNKFHFIKK